MMTRLATRVRLARNDQNGGDDGSRGCRRRVRRGAAALVAAARSPGRGVCRRGRPARAVAAGFFRQRHRTLFCADRRAALVARPCVIRRHRTPRRRPVALARLARGGDHARIRRRRICLDAAGALGPRRADAAAPHRAGRDHRSVVDIDQLDRGWRIVIAPDTIPGLEAAAQPKRIRLHIAPTSDQLRPGDGVSLKGMLYPVPAPVLPGGRDMQRELYFAGIGAVGYSFGAARRTARAEDDTLLGGWREWLMQLRSDMTKRINAALPGSTGGVASASSPASAARWRRRSSRRSANSGLSHLLAIAGLHLGLVGGFVFFAVRGGLALIPPVALRYPIKKIAAVVTLVVLFCYLMISGAAIPTQRAFVMTGIVFAAILIDRLRISMRICAIAAARRPGDRPGEPRRGQLPDVVRRGRRADRGLREMGRAARPICSTAARSRARCWGIAAPSRSRQWSRHSAPSRSRSTIFITSCCIRRWPTSSRCRSRRCGHCPGASSPAC